MANPLPSQSTSMRRRHCPYCFALVHSYLVVPRGCNQQICCRAEGQAGYRVIRRRCDLHIFIWIVPRSGSGRAEAAAKGRHGRALRPLTRAPVRCGRCRVCVYLHGAQLHSAQQVPHVIRQPVQIMLLIRQWPDSTCVLRSCLPVLFTAAR